MLNQYQDHVATPEPAALVAARKIFMVNIDQLSIFSQLLYCQLGSLRYVKYFKYKLLYFHTEWKYHTGHPHPFIQHPLQISYMARRQEAQHSRSKAQLRMSAKATASVFIISQIRSQESVTQLSLCLIILNFIRSPQKKKKTDGPRGNYVVTFVVCNGAAWSINQLHL